MLATLNASITNNNDFDTKNLKISLKPYNENMKCFDQIIKNIYKVFSHYIMLYLNYVVIPVCANNCVCNLTSDELLSIFPDSINTNNNNIFNELLVQLTDEWHKGLSTISIDFKKHTLIPHIADKYHIQQYLDGLNTDDSTSREFINTPKIVFTIDIRINVSHFNEEYDKYMISYCEKKIYEYLLKDTSKIKLLCNDPLLHDVNYLLRPYVFPIYYKELNDIGIKTDEDLYNIRYAKDDANDDANDENDANDANDAKN